MTEKEQKEFDESFSNLPEHTKKDLMFSSLVCAISISIFVVVSIISILIWAFK